MAANDNTPPSYNAIIDHEKKMHDEGAAKFRKEAEKSDLSGLDHLQSWAWPKVLKTEDALKKVILDLKAQRGGNPEAVKALDKVNLRLVAHLGFMCTLDGCDKEWTKTELMFNIGRGVAYLTYEETLMATREGRRLAERLTRAADHRADKFESRADFVEWMVAKRGFKWDAWTKGDESLCMKVGAVVLVAVQKANPDVFTQELSHVDSETKFEAYFVMFTPETVAELEEKLGDAASLSPVLSPMNTKPLPWGPHNIGPYTLPSLARMTKLVKRASPAQREYLDEAIKDGRLNNALTALNTLQETPYEINDYVVDAVDWVRKRGLGSKVPSFPHLKEVPVPNLTQEEEDALQMMDRRTYWREKKQTKAHNRQARANRTKLRRTIEMAKNLSKDWPCFYLPHNFDKRGRIYHVPDFGHHNTDYMRAMFLLSNKTAIGNDGVNWIMLSLANSWGNKVDKKSLDARLDWVREHEDEILAAGADFKKSFDFWKQADDPFQFLAACHELAEAMKVGPDYMSGLPIALDATQSGIQHYAAASLNPADGELVNLKANLSEPNDLYTACLDVAKELLEDDLKQNLEAQLQDPANDNERQLVDEHETFMADQKVPWDDRKATNDEFKRTDAAKKAARDKRIISAQQWIAHGLNRSHIKRNCMTWAYSSEQYGFGKQLQSDTMDKLSTKVRLGELDEHPFQPDNGTSAARFLAEMNYQAITSVIQSASAGMRFFQDIASIMTRDGKHLSFMTPKIGFPMHQYYRKTKQDDRGCYVYKHKLDMSEVPDSYMEKKDIKYTRYLQQVDPRESRSAIAPNIIHAMDATHLMLTVLFCIEEEVEDLMVVHDSFATTVGNAGKMSRAIRNAFVYLYKDYCLYADLLAQAKEQHSNPDSVEWPEIPRKGDKDGNLLDLDEVLEADYPFS